jgi:transmembrane sensor
MDGQAVTRYPDDLGAELDPVREAAGEWLSLLHSGEDDPALEAGFRDWLDADEGHRAAFMAMTSTWEMLGAAGEQWQAAERRRGQRRRVLAGAVAVSVAVAAGLGQWLMTDRAEVFETRHGEQRTAMLADGSRLVLNTDSRVVVRYAAHRRAISLERGEAAFDVAHDTTRPFVVTAGREDVVAVGTSFTVRMENSLDPRVTLMEGRLKLVAANDRSGGGQAVMLHAGQRWSPGQGISTLAPGETEASGAWRRGEVVFDNTPLPEAVREMNRYSAAPILLDVVRAENFRISGVFRLEDGPVFAHTLAGLYGLTAEERDGAIHILGEPQNNFSGKVRNGG